ncbi:MAG: hypothetical protein NVSMB64_26640 [Candidatus Velthaea sp.]
MYRLVTIHDSPLCLGVQLSRRSDRTLCELRCAWPLCCAGSGAGGIGKLATGTTTKFGAGGMLMNNGVLSPGAGMVTRTWHVTGTFAQSAGSTYLVDLDFANLSRKSADSLSLNYTIDYTPRSGGRL